MLEEIYNKNKELDLLFMNKYDFNSDKIIKSNKLEFMCELIELMKETKCFKYWKNNTINNTDLLYEYADGLISILTYFNLSNKNININNIELDIDLNSLFLKLIDLYNNYINNNVDNLDLILDYYILLGKKLNLKEEEIYNITLDKIKKTGELFE